MYEAKKRGRGRFGRDKMRKDKATKRSKDGKTGVKDVGMGIEKEKENRVPSAQDATPHHMDEQMDVDVDSSSQNLLQFERLKIR